MNHIDTYTAAKKALEAQAQAFADEARRLNPDLPAEDLLNLMKDVFRGLVEDILRTEQATP